MNMIQYRTFNPSWNAFDPLFGWGDELCQLAANPWTGFQRPATLPCTWTPSVDVLEDKENLYVVAELPGIRKEDLQISLHEGELSISVERKNNERKDEVYRSERQYGRMQRTISLPKPVTVEKVKASYQDGVLTVSLPISEAAQPRQIQVVTA
jgi:HSP20 family protein